MQQQLSPAQYQQNLSQHILKKISKNIFLFFLCLLMFTNINAWARDAAPYHSPQANTPIPFQMQMIDANAAGSYGLIGEDINQDGNTDLVSFAYTGTTAGSVPGEIYWYEFLGPDNTANNAINNSENNPKKFGWKKHLLAKKKHVVHGAFMDVQKKGTSDLIFMSDFEVPITHPAKEGNIWWAQRPANLNDLQEDAPWQTYWIGRSPGAHRIVAIDLDGNGTKGIVVVPLFSQGKPPMYGPATITLYIPNTNPRQPWKKTVFASPKIHALHDAVKINKNNGNGTGEDILIAGQEGIFLFSFTQDKKGAWTLQNKMLHGTPKDSAADEAARDKGVQVLGIKQNPTWDLSGVTALANFSPEHPFIATIDYTKHSGFLLDQPWHGDTVSIYLPKQNSNLFAANGLERKVLEKRAAGGHVTQIADFNGDGCFDVAAGFRAYPTSFMIYLCQKEKNNSGKEVIHYEKQIISERSANAIVISDWNKDGLPDMATVGFGENGDPYILLWVNQYKTR